MRYFAIVLVLMFATFSFSAEIDNEEIQGIYQWQITTDVISAQYGQITALDDVNVTTISDDNCITQDIPKGEKWFGIEWRFRIADGNENDICVLELYSYSDSNSSSGKDYWRHEATITVTQGTMLYSNLTYFADTVADSNNACYVNGSDSASSTDSFGTFSRVTYGKKKFKWVASTLYDTDKIYIDRRRW